MFERNRIDNASNTGHQTAVPAELTLNDGSVVSGHFLISSARAIGDVLNSEALFFEFEPFDGERRFISKHAISAFRLLSVAPADGLDARRPISGAFDPYSALGVKRDADWDDIRQAYLRLAKAYHADRYASIDLPTEVREYLQQMSRRVNAAYTALEAPRQVVRNVALRADPVYTSQPRF
jgi:hypothetical protein